MPDLVASPIQVLLIDDADEPIANRECRIVFRDNQEITRETNAEGILKFIKRTDGAFKLILQEES